MLCLIQKKNYNPTKKNKVTSICLLSLSHKTKLRRATLALNINIQLFDEFHQYFLLFFLLFIVYYFDLSKIPYQGQAIVLYFTNTIIIYQPIPNARFADARFCWQSASGYKTMARVTSLAALSTESKIGPHRIINFK